MKIDTQHEKYKNCWNRWKMAMDFYRGGRFVLEPDWQASFGHIIKEYDNIIEGDISRAESHYEWIPAYSNSYLWKHPSERAEEYNERHARAYHTPLVGPIFNIFSSGIFRAGQSRNHTETIYEDFFSNCDLLGNNIDTFIRNCFAAVAMPCGRCHAIVDVPRYSGYIASFEQQQKLGLRAFVRMISPLDLVDWEMDFYGKFKWIKIIEPAENNRTPYEQQDNKTGINYRIITRENWELYNVGERGTITLIDEGPLPDTIKGEVPIATLWTYSFKEMDCESPLGSIVDADRHLFNKNSELDTVERMNGFSILGVPNIEGVPLGFIELGPGRALTYPAQAGPPVWLSSDPDILKGLADRNRERMDIVRIAAGVARGAAEGSKELRSAAALDEENETKRNQMTVWATACEEFENEILRFVAKYNNIESTKTVYRKNFSLRAVSAQINDLLQLKATETLPGTAQVEMAKPMVERIMQENGIDPDIISKVLNSMKDIISSEYKTPTMGKIKPKGFEGQGQTNPGVVNNE